MNTAFIGGGNMAGAMIAGMHAKGVNGETIWVSDPHPEKREKLHALYGAVGFEGAGEWLKKADVVVLAVKPQKLKDCCETLKPFVSEKALVLSVAAGVKLEVLRAWLNHKRIVRAIPNTPAMVLKGFSGLYVPSDVDEDARKAAHTVLESVGEVKDLTHEDGLHLVTSGPGSGPAYVFLFMEALAEALVKGGATPADAHEMALSTVEGAAALARKSSEDFAQLRANVTSKDGTTAKAIEAFEVHDFCGTVEAAVKACAARSKEMSEMFS